MKNCKQCNNQATGTAFVAYHGGLTVMSVAYVCEGHADYFKYDCIGSGQGRIHGYIPGFFGNVEQVDRYLNRPEPSNWKKRSGRSRRTRRRRGLKP